MTAKHEPLPVATTLFATGLSGRNHRGAGTSKADLPAETGAAVAAVYVLTAASGESHCIERIYLGADQARGFAQAYNRIAPGGPVQATDGMK